jgi:5-bromo-4-chloroindolyl phosphate hydrolysis protein
VFRRKKNIEEIKKILSEMSATVFGMYEDTQITLKEIKKSISKALNGNINGNGINNKNEEVKKKSKKNGIS